MAGGVLQFLHEALALLQDFFFALQVRPRAVVELGDSFPIEIYFLLQLLDPGLEFPDAALVFVIDNAAQLLEFFAGSFDICFDSLVVLVGHDDDVLHSVAITWMRLIWRSKADCECCCCDIETYYNSRRQLYNRVQA